MLLERLILLGICNRFEYWQSPRDERLGGSQESCLGVYRVRLLI